jgi:hypothetical protein
MCGNEFHQLLQTFEHCESTMNTRKQTISMKET